jgi:hypothetical protein
LNNLAKDGEEPVAVLLDVNENDQPQKQQQQLTRQKRQFGFG